jgi:2-dehydrotetronate isomerase
LARHGLTQALFNLPPGNWHGGERGLAAIPGREEEFRASVRAVSPYVQATGVKRLHVMSGHARNDDLQALLTYKDNLRFACEWAAPLNVEVLIEPINSRDMPGYFMNSFTLATELIASSSISNLKLQYDIYHRQILHGDILKSLEELRPIISHIQVASVPKRNEPGTGELDDDTIFAHLDQMGYQGFVGCEYRPANGTLAGLGWFR